MGVFVFFWLTAEVFKVKSTVLLRKIRQIKCGFAGLLGNLFWLIARVPKVKSCFAPLASQTDGRVTFVLETKVTKNS